MQSARQKVMAMDHALRLSRRQILLAAAAALVLPAPAPRSREGTIRIVDGWVLTERDVAALGQDAG